MVDDESIKSSLSSSPLNLLECYEHRSHYQILLIPTGGEGPRPCLRSTNRSLGAETDEGNEPIHPRTRRRRVRVLY